MKAKRAEVTKTRIAIAGAYKCTPRELALAELMALGWKPLDALVTLGLVPESTEYDRAQVIAESYSTRDCVQDAYSKRVAQLKGGIMIGTDGKIHPSPTNARANAGRKKAEGAALSDMEILNEMWDTIKALDKDNPRRAQLLETYYKTKRRQGEKDDDDATIHFYLPKAECDNCPLSKGVVISDPTIQSVEGKAAARREGTYVEPKPEPTGFEERRGRPTKAEAERRRLERERQEAEEDPQEGQEWL